MQKQIAILGAGNIGLAIAEGIQKANLVSERIVLTRRGGDFSDEERLKFSCSRSNTEAVASADVVIVAVQPKQVDGVLTEIKGGFKEGAILVSVASGVKLANIEALVGEMPIVRAMPNTAIRVGQSMTCLAFNEKGEDHENIVTSIFSAVGLTLRIPEARFPEATVLCGSGTAIVLKFIRALMQAGIQHGFNERDSLMIATQVVKGAPIILQLGDSHPEAEIDKVTTPLGCTIATLIEMEHSGFSSAILKAIEAGIDRAYKLYS